MEWLMDAELWGLFLWSFLAATVLPISSEPYVLILLAGGTAAWQCLVFASVGNTLGGMTSYGLGWLGKLEWIEKYLRVKSEKLDALQGRVNRWGGALAWLTWLPFLGDPLAIALGFFKVKPLQVIPGMFFGKLARYAVLIYVGEIMLF